MFPDNIVSCLQFAYVLDWSCINAQKLDKKKKEKLVIAHNGLLLKLDGLTYCSLTYLL